MSLFSQFETDPELEKTGIILHYGLNSKGQPIGIRVARAGGANEQFNKRVEALFKPHRRQVQSNSMDRKLLVSLMKQAYAETVVLGWENVEDKSGNPMTFSKQACLDLFEQLPDLYADVQEQAQMIMLFRQELREEDAKN